VSLRIHIDGGARGNPGPAAAGVVLRDDQDRAILEAGYYLGRMTNNMAEYTALLMALEAAARWGADEIAVFSDSELLVRQITGEYRVRDEKLRHLFEQVQKLLLKFDTWQIKHVPRDENRRADELVNKSLNLQADVVEVQQGDARPERRPGATEMPEAAAGTKRTSAAPEILETGAEVPVLAEIVQPPDPRVCQAHHAEGQRFLFTHTVPSGLCIYAAKALMETVFALRYAAGGEPPPPVRVRCGRPGCGAEFEVRLAGKPEAD